MELVKSVKDILENAKRFDEYLQRGNFEEKEFALQSLIAGRCFVVINSEGKYKFYPSKYIGYKGNSVSGYANGLQDSVALPGEAQRYGDAGYSTFDGRMSNKALNQILKCKCMKEYAMSEKFIAYCNKYGLKGSEKKKFWLNVIESK